MRFDEGGSRFSLQVDVEPENPLFALVSDHSLHQDIAALVETYAHGSDGVSVVLSSNFRRAVENSLVQSGQHPHYPTDRGASLPVGKMIRISPDLYQIVVDVRILDERGSSGESQSERRRRTLLHLVAHEAVQIHLARSLVEDDEGLDEDEAGFESDQAAQSDFFRSVAWAFVSEFICECIVNRDRMLRYLDVDLEDSAEALEAAIQSASNGSELDALALRMALHVYWKCVAFVAGAASAELISTVTFGVGKYADALRNKLPAAAKLASVVVSAPSIESGVIVEAIDDVARVLADWAAEIGLDLKASLKDF